MALGADFTEPIVFMKAVLGLNGDDDLDKLVDAIFDPLKEGADPASFNAPISTVLSGLGPIAAPGAGESKGASLGIVVNEELGHMSDVGDSLLPWSGAAASNFRKNYASLFPGVTANQDALGLAIAHALRAEQKIWETYENDCVTLATKTAKAISDAEDSGADPVAIVCTVAGALIPLVGVEIGAAELFTAAAGLGASHDTFDVGGDFPILVLVSAVQGAEKIKKNVQTQEDKLRRSMTTVADFVQHNNQHFMLMPPQLAADKPDIGVDYQ